MSKVKSFGDQGLKLNRRWLLQSGVLACGAAALPSAAGAQSASTGCATEGWEAPIGEVNPLDDVNPPRPENLKKPGQVDARFPISYRRSVPAACRVMAAHFDAVATRDYKKLAKTLQFPFAIIENIDAIVVNSPDDLTDVKAPPSLNFSPTGKRYTDHNSMLKPGAYDMLVSMELINFDPVRVNMAMTFDRYDENGKRMQRCEGVYCVTNNDGRWAIQLLSTIWTPDTVIGMVYQDAIEAAIRLRADHVISYVDDNPADEHFKPTRGPRVGITGGGIGSLMNSQQSDNQMALFAIKGVKTRLSASNRPPNGGPGGPGFPGGGPGGRGGRDSNAPLPEGSPTNTALGGIMETPHLPKDYQNYKEFSAMGWAWGSPWVPKASRVIHQCANKVHRFSGVTRFNVSGEEESTSMEVAVVVRGTSGEWTDNGGLAYITMHDRLNDVHTA